MISLLVILNNNSKTHKYLKHSLNRVNSANVNIDTPINDRNIMNKSKDFSAN